MLKSVAEKCWRREFFAQRCVGESRCREVLERRVAEECEEVFGKCVVEKPWGRELFIGNFEKKCWRNVLQRSVEETCCRHVLAKSVVEKRW